MSPVTKGIVLFHWWVHDDVVTGSVEDGYQTGTEGKGFLNGCDAAVLSEVMQGVDASCARVGRCCSMQYQ